jgi:hypothetical protein
LNSRWTVGLVLAGSACASRADLKPHVSPELARSFAAVTDSVSFSDSRYGWSECCWSTLLVLRPRGTWTFVRVDSTVRWFEAAADSVTFRGVTARLLALGFVSAWPMSLGSTGSDIPTATLTLRAPGQCHQTSASPGLSGEPPPLEWQRARAVLDSLAAHVKWQRRAPPAWAVANLYEVVARPMCKPEELFR